MEAFCMKSQREWFLFVLVGYSKLIHDITHTRQLTHNSIAFPLLRAYQLIGILCVTFGSIPLVQNIQTNIEKNSKHR